MSKQEGQAKQPHFPVYIMHTVKQSLLNIVTLGGVFQKTPG